MKKFISILMMIMVVFTICSCEYNNYYGFDENGNPLPNKETPNTPTPEQTEPENKNPSTPEVLPEITDPEIPEVEDPIAPKTYEEVNSVEIPFLFSNTNSKYKILAKINEVDTNIIFKSTPKEMIEGTIKLEAAIKISGNIKRIFEGNFNFKNNRIELTEGTLNRINELLLEKEYILRISCQEDWICGTKNEESWIDSMNNFPEYI